tara:strand:+ start:151 stop:516 length:366 start_codon:yes stop_codon:yes gene_type:complete
MMTNCSSDNGGISQEGYFKSDMRDRIFTFSILPTTTETQILAHAKKQMNTSGKLTGCYYFPQNARIPRDGITLAKSLYHANEVINDFASGIDYAFLRRGDGNYWFVNCIENPNDDLCIEHE